MTNFDIKINTRSLLIRSNKLGVKKDRDTLNDLMFSFAHRVMDLYKSMIEEAIMTSRYEGVWEPVEERGYIEYLGVVPDTNIYKILFDSLEVVKAGYHYIIRISPRYKYPGTSISLSKVIRAIEYGTSEFNARPLLTRISREMNYSVVDLWENYLIVKGVV